MVAEPRAITVEDFLALPDDGDRHEYVRGEVRSTPLPASRHGQVLAIFVEHLSRHLYKGATALGWRPEQGFAARKQLVGFAACGEFGMRFTLPDDPLQIRGADCVYVPPEQLAETGWDGEGYFPAVPHLAIEVISDSESAAEVAEKVQDYLAGGARRVWCVYPQLRSVHVHAIDGPTRVLRRKDMLTDDDLLPGFALPLSWIF